MIGRAERGESHKSGQRPESFRVRRKSEFVESGGKIREANLKQDAQAVRDLYVSPHVIEHLSGVSPDYPAGNIRTYYKDHPNATLLVAEVPQKGIVGALTIAPEDGGLYSAKLNRLVVREDQQRKGVAYSLIREALARTFSSSPAGLGCEQVFAAVILEVKGHEGAIAAFEKFDFDFFGGRLKERCDGWSIEEDRMRRRDTRQLLLQREDYVMRYGRDLRRVQPTANPLQVFPPAVAS